MKQTLNHSLKTTIYTAGKRENRIHSLIKEIWKEIYASPLALANVDSAETANRKLQSLANKRLFFERF